MKVGRFGRSPRVTYQGIDLTPNPGYACDPIPEDTRPLAFKQSSIGDPEWGMYVTPDDPMRDTPAKARVYYEKLFAIMDPWGTSRATVATASAADLEAAKALLGA